MLKTDFNHNTSPVFVVAFIPNGHRYMVGVKIWIDGLVCRRMGISCQCNPLNPWAKRMLSCQSPIGCQGIFYLCNPFNPWAKTVRGCPLRRCHTIDIQLIKNKYLEYTKNNTVLYTKNTTFTYTKYGTLAFTKYATEKIVFYQPTGKRLSWHHLRKNWHRH